MDGATLPEGYRRELEARQARGAAVRHALARRFPDGTPLTLEIGCGHGHYLAAYAAQHPQEQCLGVDLITRRIERARRKRDLQGLANLHFLKADAGECLEAMPAGLTLQRVFLLFPDPWPKRRHHKNRILQPAFLDLLAMRAMPGMPLHFRTDHWDNFAWGMDVLASHPHWAIEDDAHWPLEMPTVFQDLLGTYLSLTAFFRPDSAGAEVAADAG